MGYLVKIVSEFAGWNAPQVNVVYVFAGGDALQVQDAGGSRRVPGDRPQRARADRGPRGAGHHAPLPRQHGHVPRDAPGLERA